MWVAPIRRKIMEYKMTIRGNFYGKNKIFPSLNDYIHACAKSPQVGAKMKRDYQMIACNAIRKQLSRVSIKRPIKIHYFFYEPDCKRDISNVASFFVKVFEDALQDCKVIPNDNWAHVKGYTQDFEIDAVNPRVEIVIEEI
jgi:Holliday junction resolvase RusA-like endonuclease